MKKSLRKESKYNSAALKPKDRGGKSAFKDSRCFQAPHELLWHTASCSEPPPALYPPSAPPKLCVDQSHMKDAEATACGTNITPWPPHGSYQGTWPSRPPGLLPPPEASGRCCPIRAALWNLFTPLEFRQLRCKSKRSVMFYQHSQKGL